MTIDVHAHVTVDPTSQLQRASRAGVDQTVLLSTRVHPEAADSPEQVRAEYSRLTTVIGGGATSTKAFEAGMNELRLALDAHPGTTVGFVNVALDQTANSIKAWIARYLAEARIVGIGELTPTPGATARIEPVLQASADHGGVPVLTHGFAPNTAQDLATYADLAARYPSVPLIVGAFGGLNCLQLIDLAHKRRNLYVDLSSALQVFAVRAAAHEIPEQCLFGSNTPYGDVVAARHTVEAAISDPAVLQQILHNNTAALIQSQKGGPLALQPTGC
jgi:predicted TIM-barrel fold metal-dependent hydrolase